LQKCVKSWEIIEDIDYELLIIEDGCTDGTAEWLDSVTDGERIRWFHEDDVYETLSDNRGMREAKGEYVLIWQDDMYILAPNFARWVIEILAAYPEISVLSLKRGILLKPLAYDSKTGELISKPGNSHFQRFGLPHMVAEVHGTVRPWIVRKSWIDQLGVMDEVYAPFHFDEVDYQMQIRAHGGRIGTIPAEQMRLYVHNASSTTSKVNRKFFEDSIYHNGLILHQRWDSQKGLLAIPTRKAWRVPDMSLVRFHVLNFYWFLIKKFPYMIQNGFPI
jgi:glycosyltransferase involved in cell wall biosynthesis